jgi:exo-beta-1,3-glucanase (GH17 family)/cellulose synthase/poly-beta-1,6-N-acetylglucosamine synthase-like glycosyltransferase
MRARVMGLLVSAVLLGANFAGWETGNEPRVFPEAPGPLTCVAYDFEYRNPSFDGTEFTTLTEARIEEDLRRIAQMAGCVRTYSCREGSEMVPRVARRLGLEVVPTAWLEADEEANALEIAGLIRIVNENDNVPFALVGNETLLFDRLPLAELVTLLDEVRRSVRVPVSTGEPSHLWLAHPELADHVDFIAVQALPYSAGVAHEDAVAHTLDIVQGLASRFDKPALISETGWPSRGAQLGRAVPGLREQAEYVRLIAHEAGRRDLFYNLIGAYDAPWQARHSQRADAFYGLMDLDGREKFSRSGPLVLYSGKHGLAWGTTLLTLLLHLLFVARHRQLRLAGWLIGLGGSYLVVLLAAGVAHVIRAEYLYLELTTWLLLVPAVGYVCLLLLYQLFLAAEIVGDMPLARQVPQSDIVGAPKPGEGRMISVHLATCNEPPEMVIETVRSLLRMDYTPFEIIVLDNNTADESKWRPLEEFCGSVSGPVPVKFQHVEKMPGLKAGALNLCLELTDPKAELVAIVDADFILEPDWFRQVAPLFDDRAVAAVQVPQAYHAPSPGTPFEAMHDEYRLPFELVMPQLNERNAIFLHGGMGVLRLSSLREIGGWRLGMRAEDSELGLRLLEAGHTLRYYHRVFGRGQLPPSVEAWAKQRRRWAAGCMEQLLRHWRELLGLRPNRMTLRQRFHLLAAWASWLTDGLFPVFLGLYLLFGVYVALKPERYLAPPELLAPVAIYALSRSGLALWAFRTRRPELGWLRSLRMLFAAASLVKAVSAGLFSALRALFMRARPGWYRTARSGEASAAGGARPRLPRSVAAEIGLSVVILALGLTPSARSWAYGAFAWDAAVWLLVGMAVAAPLLASAVMRLREHRWLLGERARAAFAEGRQLCLDRNPWPVPVQRPTRESEVVLPSTAEPEVAPPPG